MTANVYLIQEVVKKIPKKSGRGKDLCSANGVTRTTLLRFFQVV